MRRHRTFDFWRVLLLASLGVGCAGSSALNTATPAATHNAPPEDRARAVQSSEIEAAPKAVSDLPSADTCASPDVTQPMGASAPPEGWWRSFVEQEPLRLESAHYPGVVAPKVRIRFEELMLNTGVKRAQRKGYGYHRLCYNQHLSRDPTFEGYWVIRVSQSSSNEICSLEVIASNLPKEMETCLQERLRHLDDYGSTSGTFEIAFTYWPKPQHR